MSAQHRFTRELYLGYTPAIGKDVSWDGTQWVPFTTFWGEAALGTYTTHQLRSSATSFSVAVADADGNALAATTQAAWTDVVDRGAPDWLYMGEVYTDEFAITAQYRWFYLRPLVEPEPVATLGPEQAL
jgi:hypothetical protein